MTWENESTNNELEEEEKYMIQQVDIYDRPTTRLRKLADASVQVYRECPVVKLRASNGDGEQLTRMIFVKDLKENPIGTSFSVGDDLEYPEYRSVLMILNKRNDEVHLMYITSGYDEKGNHDSFWKEEKEFIFRFN